MRKAAVGGWLLVSGAQAALGVAKGGQDCAFGPSGHSKAPEAPLEEPKTVQKLSFKSHLTQAPVQNG